MIEIDGRYGEGGGQIVRTSLALSTILQVPVHITGIRANRKKQGLKPQHVTCVQAMAAISDAEVQGGKLESMELSFTPRARRSGRYAFNVADVRSSAGSVTLILQSLVPALLFGEKRSQVAIRGGTHVDWSPSGHYFMHVFVPMLAMMGASVRVSLDRLGWYPAGNGAVTVDIEPVQELLGLQLEDRGELKALRGLSISSKLPMGVSKRQRKRADEMLTQAGFDPHIRMVDTPASCPGTTFFLWAEFEKSWAGFGSLGRRGKPAETVAEEAVTEFLHFMESGATVDEHMADQLVIYMALAKGLSTLTTPRITPHLTTSIWVVEQFLPVKFEVEGNEGEPGKVSRIR